MPRTVNNGTGHQWRAWTTTSEGPRCGLRHFGPGSLERDADDTTNTSTKTHAAPRPPNDASNGSSEFHRISPVASL